MSKEEPIFELIHSLSASEKGYFKKNSPAGERIYIKLFDLINSQDDYNEETILKKLRGENISKNFSVSKRYLYDCILSSLVNYQQQTNVESQLNNDIESIRILYNKGLYTQTEKMLARAKEKAREYELYHHLLQLMAFEYSYNQFKMYDSAKLFEEEKEVLALLQDINSGNQWYWHILSWVQKNDKAKTPGELQEIATLFGNIEQGIHPAKTFKGINTFHAANTIYNYSIGNMEEAANAKIRQLDSYIANPKLREVNYKTFLLVYGNVLSLLYNSNDKIRFGEYYEKFAELKSAKKGQLILEKEIEFAHGVGLFKLNNDLEGGIRFIKKIEPELEELQHKVSVIRISDILYNASVMFFWAGDLRSSLKWLNRILNNERIESRQYMYCCARIFELLLHLELGNNQLLLSLSKSTFRYLYKRNKVHDFENIIMVFLKKLIRCPLNEQTSVFNNLKLELEKLMQDPVRSKAMDHFDYLKWLEQKTKS